MITRSSNFSPIQWTRWRHNMLTLHINHLANVLCSFLIRSDFSSSVVCVCARKRDAVIAFFLHCDGYPLYACWRSLRSQLLQDKPCRIDHRFCLFSIHAVDCVIVELHSRAPSPFHCVCFVRHYNHSAARFSTIANVNDIASEKRHPHKDGT